MRASAIASLLLCLAVMPATALCGNDDADGFHDDGFPDDEFLEFLGAWDEAWTEACKADDELPGDDACAEYDDEQNDAD